MFWRFSRSCRHAWSASRPAPVAVALALPRAPALAGHALTALSTERASSSSGRCRIGLHALESASLVEDRPGDAGELVGERNRQHVVVQALFGSLDPGLESVAFPMLWPDLDQHHPGCLDEQGAQIAIATL